MIDPHKIGSVMWARSPNDLQVPLDLHGRISLDDETNLNSVFDVLMSTRKVVPALELIRERTWVNMGIIRPYLILSMEGRSEARQMKAENLWDDFWSFYN